MEPLTFAAPLLNPGALLTFKTVTYALRRVTPIASDGAVIVRFEEFAGVHRFVFTLGGVRYHYQDNYGQTETPACREIGIL